MIEAAAAEVTMRVVHVSDADAEPVC